MFVLPRRRRFGSAVEWWLSYQGLTVGAGEGGVVYRPLGWCGCDGISVAKREVWGWDWSSIVIWGQGGSARAGLKSLLRAALWHPAAKYGLGAEGMLPLAVWGLVSAVGVRSTKALWWGLGGGGGGSIVHGAW